MKEGETGMNNERRSENKGRIVHWFFNGDFILAMLSYSRTPVDPHLMLTLLLHLRTVALPNVFFGF